METAEADVLAYVAFPPEHWRQRVRTNPLERVTKKVKRRTDVGGSFPNEAAVVRLVGPCSPSSTTSSRWLNPPSAPSPWPS